jgi:hypothetical protein
MRAFEKTTDASTTEWIRGLRTRRDEFVGRHTNMTLDRVSWTEATSVSPVVETPVNTWSGGARYKCSFCREECDEDFRVDFNQVLTSPFVVTCGPCTRKIR